MNLFSDTSTLHIVKDNSSLHINRVVHMNVENKTCRKVYLIINNKNVQTFMIMVCKDMPQLL